MAWRSSWDEWSGALHCAVVLSDPLRHRVGIFPWALEITWLDYGSIFQSYVHTMGGDLVVYSEMTLEIFFGPPLSAYRILVP